VPNEEAPVIQWAFETLSTGQYSVEEVRRFCVQKGFNFNRNRFNLMMKNPAYCGRIIVPAYKNEEEEVVKGIHEPLISEELYEKVQDVLTGRRRKNSYKVTLKEQFPLRGFLKCPVCDNNWTGSTSIGRAGTRHDYYHCVRGCKQRVKAENVNASFLKLIGQINFRQEVTELYELILESVFGAGAKEKKASRNELQKEIDRNKERIEKAQQLMLDGDIAPDEYKAIKKGVDAKIEDLLKQQLTFNRTEPEHKFYIRKGVMAIKNLPLLFEKLPIKAKQELIGSIFSEKLVFQDNVVRTSGVNSLVSLCCLIGGAFSGSENEKESENRSLSLLVAGDGFEPTTFGL
jgi:heterodisulfide reductase subunit C